MGLIHELTAGSGEEYTVLPGSYVKTEQGELVMLLRGGEEMLAVNGGYMLRFSGENRENHKICPTNHANRLVLNELFPYTAPIAFGPKTGTFGFGDRLGFAGAAQVRAVQKTPMRPILAQQSLRELQLTGRTLTEVIDRAAWAVFREGYRKGYGCDGDHLKTLDEVQNAISEGCSMITLDCSLVMGCAGSAAAQEHSGCNGEVYLRGKEAAAMGLHFSEECLVRLHSIYDGPLDLCERVYREAILPAGRPIDFEVSLDETVETTTPEAHYFVACELRRRGIAATSVAPRFVGEFQKAIEYIGDTAELERTMRIHAAIAARFGYKLSLHSASEKFLALPILMRATGGSCHIKTSGTSWLEVVETISKHDAALYRRIHAAALEGIEEAKKNYVVHCDPGKVPLPDTVEDVCLPEYLLHDDSRQLLHITYGYILHIPELKADILQFLRDNRALYEAEAQELYERHFDAMYGKT